MLTLTPAACPECGLICERRDLPHPRELECPDCRRRAWDEIDHRLDMADWTDDEGW